MDDETKKTLEQVAEAVTPAVTESVIAKIKNDKPTRKAIFGDTGADNDVEEQKKEAASMLQKLARGEVKALTSGGSGTGAELVPTYVSDNIVRVADDVGLVRKYGRKWPMQGVKENVPTPGSATAYRVNEGVKINSSTPSTAVTSLSAKTVGVLIPFSKKLLLGANVNVVDVLTNLAGEAIAKLEDQWAMKGLGAGEGVFQHASVTGVTMASGDVTFAKTTAEHLLDMIDKLDMSAVDPSKVRWVMHLSVLNVLRKLRAAVSTDKQGFLFQGFGGSTPPTIWDLPYSLSPVMPKTSDGSQASTKFLALANFDYILHGDLKNYTVEISDQATITDSDGSTLINLFEQNMVAVKVSGEVDIQLAEAAKAFAWLRPAAS